ncbi:hypothetical protein D9M68_779360 [compost metagenome]
MFRIVLRTEHRHHRGLHPVAGLPGVPRHRHLLLALLHLDGMHRAHLGQGAPLHPGCRGVELLEHRREPLGRGAGDEPAEPDREGRWRRHHQRGSREQPGEVQERRRHRPSRRPCVQPVRQRLRLHLRGCRHRLHALSAEHARHAGMALQHPRGAVSGSTDSRPARDRHAHRPESLGQRLSAWRLPAPGG